MGDIVRRDGNVVVLEDLEQRRVVADDAGGAPESLCLITGERTTPVPTLPLITGFQKVGGKGPLPLFGFDTGAYTHLG